MRFIAFKLNYLASELDRKYNLNSGGCCYFAYKVAYWLEKYGIDYYFIIQNDKPIAGTGKHYCLQILPECIFLNKHPNFGHIKSLKKSASEMLEYYNKSKWSEKYDPKMNIIISECVDSVFKL